MLIYQMSSINIEEIKKNSHNRWSLLLFGRWDILVLLRFLKLVPLVCCSSFCLVSVQVKLQIRRNSPTVWSHVISDLWLGLFDLYLKFKQTYSIQKQSKMNYFWQNINVGTTKNLDFLWNTASLKNAGISIGIRNLFNPCEWKIAPKDGWTLNRSTV